MNKNIHYPEIYKIMNDSLDKDDYTVKIDVHNLFSYEEWTYAITIPNIKKPLTITYCSGFCAKQPTPNPERSELCIFYPGAFKFFSENIVLNTEKLVDDVLFGKITKAMQKAHSNKTIVNEVKLIDKNNSDDYIISQEINRNKDIRDGRRNS